MLILSACGGSAKPQAHASTWQTVAGAGYRFQAPKGWKVDSGPRRTTASHGADLVQVSTFPLVRSYSDALFDKVELELRARMDDLARLSGAKVIGTKTVTANGARAHMYALATADHVDEYTFVLGGKREYQLLCRRAAGKQADYCARLVTSFAA